MPDTPRTLWELVHQFFQGAYVDGRIDMTLFLDNVNTYGPDALIGAQGRVVYTEEDVETAAIAGYEEEFSEIAWEDANEVVQDVARRIARAAITAAGGVVADKVLESEFSHDIYEVDNDHLVEIDPGDKLYIVRAKEATDGQEA